MSSSSESDAPEIITLKTGKSQSKRQNKELEERQKLAARLKKEKNQARDVRLKAESAGKKSVAGIHVGSPEENERKHKGKAKEHALDVEEDLTRLERRMERAMAAADEDDESGDSDDSEDDSDVLMHEDDANSTVEEDSDEEDSDEEPEVSLNPDYLPEYYFDQLASSSRPSSVLKKTEIPVGKRKRKAKDRRKQEEKVIGSIIIRKLSSSSLSAVGRTTPSTNAKRFLCRQLKGDIRTKGWERRPVAIGSLASRTRPAARFVRG